MKIPISTGERPFLEILQDRRFWVIHLLTIPSLFIAGLFCVLSGFIQLIFNSSNTFNNNIISIQDDRFS